MVGWMANCSAEMMDVAKIEKMAVKRAVKRAGQMGCWMALKTRYFELMVEFMVG